MEISKLPSTLKKEEVLAVFAKFQSRLQKNYSLLFHINAQIKLKLTFENLGVIAGEADTDKSCITLNLQLMERDPQLFEEIFGHELAHILVNKIYQKSMGHGKEWEKAVRALGVAVKPCHDYDVEDFRTSTQAVYKYKCNCSEHKISIEMHKKIQNKPSVCKKCNSTARFISKVG